MRIARCVVLLVVFALFAGCAGSGPKGSSPAARTASVDTVAARTTTSVVTKLLVFVVENHSLAQMQSQMPYTFGLAKKYAYASAYFGISHPSLPNYLAMAGGSTFGVADDNSPSAHLVRGRSVFGQALANGRTAKVYAEGMPSRCALTDGGAKYAVKHNPWAYFVDERAQCARFDVRLRRLAPNVRNGTLPAAGMVIPNLCNDAHDCSLAQADAWIEQRVRLVMSGPDWAAGRLAVVVTADEDDYHGDNRVLTVVAAPGLASHVVTSRLDHYSLTRLYDDVLGVRYLRAARGAASMTTAFGLRVRPRP